MWMGMAGGIQMLRQWQNRHADEDQVYLAESTRDGERGTYMAGKVTGLRFMSQNKKRARTVGLLAEVYTSELGAVYMEDPSWFAWHNSTVPTREREMASGLGTGTLHLRVYCIHRKGRETNIQPYPTAQDGHTQGSPLP